MSTRVLKELKSIKNELSALRHILDPLTREEQALLQKARRNTGLTSDELLKKLKR